MTIHDIENMSVAELKAKKEELGKLLVEEEPAVLAARYVQARLDAKQRDQKLSEQGVTIQSLNVALESANQQIQGHIAVSAANDQKILALTDAQTAMAKQHTDLEQSALDATSKLQTANQALQDDNAKLKKLASDRRMILAKITSDIAPLLAAE